MIGWWQVLFEESREGSRARRRAGATVALAVFFLGLLAAAGLLKLVLAVFAIGGVATCAGAAVALARRYRRAAWLATRAALSAGTAGARLLCTRGSLAALVVRPHLVKAARRARYERRATASRLRLAYFRGARRVAHATPVVLARLERAATWLQQPAAAPRHEERGWPGPTRIDRQREALALNNAGTQLRKDEAYEAAAERHRAALTIFRELGDRRSEALTLNNLALALSRAGDAAAVPLFEEAATILRELGDDQHEGQVIANLGLAHRRSGRDERSAELLETALGKLSPGSDAYRRVESQLRRAS